MVWHKVNSIPSPHTVGWLCMWGQQWGCIQVEIWCRVCLCGGGGGGTSLQEHLEPSIIYCCHGCFSRSWQIWYIPNQAFNCTIERKHDFDDGFFTNSLTYSCCTFVIDTEQRLCTLTLQKDSVERWSAMQHGRQDSIWLQGVLATYRPSLTAYIQKKTDVTK